MKIFLHSIVALLLFAVQYPSMAQTDSTEYLGDFGGLFQLDSIVVSARRQGFDVEDFISYIENDESFYNAFRGIRFVNYRGIHELKMYDKKGREKAHYNSEVIQKVEGLCRTMDFISEDYSKNYYKRKNKHRFYTGQLLDRLFQTKGKVCESQRSSNPTEGQSGNDGKNVRELKKLIFSPGQKVDVPFIGKKTAIFDKKMAPYYNFSITSKIYKGTIDCYVFKAAVKPEFLNHQKDKTVIKFLETYFNKSNFDIVARSYQLSYSGALFDFDVNMDIECQPFGESFLPSKITYDGVWDIPARKPERAIFTISILNPN